MKTLSFTLSLFSTLFLCCCGQVTRTSLSWVTLDEQLPEEKAFLQSQYACNNHVLQIASRFPITPPSPPRRPDYRQTNITVHGDVYANNRPPLMPKIGDSYDPTSFSRGFEDGQRRAANKQIIAANNQRQQFIRNAYIGCMGKSGFKLKRHEYKDNMNMRDVDRFLSQ